METATLPRTQVVSRVLGEGEKKERGLSRRSISLSLGGIGGKGGKKEENLLVWSKLCSHPKGGEERKEEAASPVSFGHLCSYQEEATRGWREKGEKGEKKLHLFRLCAVR